MTEEPTRGEPKPAPTAEPAPGAEPAQPPPETSKAGIACLGILIAIVAGIIALAAIAGRGA